MRIVYGSAYGSRTTIRLYRESTERLEAAYRAMAEWLGTTIRLYRESTERSIVNPRTHTPAQGKSTGNPNYGFEVGEDGKLIENEQEQAVLQRVAELRAQGKSWARVAGALTDAGVRTRRGTVFSRQGLSKIAKRAGIK